MNKEIVPTWEEVELVKEKFSKMYPYKIPLSGTEAVACVTALKMSGRWKKLLVTAA